MEADDFPIAEKIDILLKSDSGAAMVKATALCLLGVTQALERIKPQILLVLGDRDEMLAGAIAAAHMKIAVAHIHGGELSGSIDGSIRHAISKFAHIHFPVTPRPPTAWPLPAKKSGGFSWWAPPVWMTPGLVWR